MKTPEDLALEKAKIQLMMKPDTIFYTTILFSLIQTWEPDKKKIPTAGTDGNNLIINPEYFLGLTEAERIGLLVHEVLHVALSHMTRCGNRDPIIWNYAGDYIINNLLVKNHYTLPPTDLIDSQYDQLNTEQLYKIIYKKAKQNAQGAFGKDGKSPKGIGQDIMYPKSIADKTVKEQDIADIVLRASVQSEAANQRAGAVPGEVKIALEKVINPKLPWNVLLQNYMTNFAKDDFTWQRPNRRFMPDYYLPTAYSESICNIAVAVDSSGSVSKREFSYFIREIAAIQETMHPEKITLIDFDTRIRSIQEITQDTDIFNELKFTGGGGTDVKEMLIWAKTNKPDILLVFTDGEFSMPAQQHHPFCSTIWLIHGRRKFTSPFGEIITYDIHNN